MQKAGELVTMFSSYSVRYKMTKLGSKGTKKNANLQIFLKKNSLVFSERAGGATV